MKRKSEDPPSPAGKRAAPKLDAWHSRGSLLVRDYSSPSSERVAGFDLDDTLVSTKSGAKFAQNADDWQWWDAAKVPSKLRELAGEGYKLVVFTNQKGIAGGQTDAETFKGRVDRLQRALDLPLLVLAATADDLYRKPRTAAWTTMVQEYNGGRQPALPQCFFVGDAAGRPKAGKVKKDFADTDMKFGFNLGVKFQTPEECFRGKADPARPVPAKFDFDPRQLSEGGGVKKRPASLGPAAPGSREVVVVVGPPGSGKSFLAKTHFAGYALANQDTLKTREKCLGAVREALSGGGSAVVDNQNRDRATRKLYVDAARAAGVPARAVLLDVPKDLCFHLNVYRSLNAASAEHRGPDRVPSMVIHSYFKSLEPPDVKEGFSEVVKLDISHFQPCGSAADVSLLRSFLQ